MYKINPKVLKLYRKYKAELIDYYGIGIEDLIQSHSSEKRYYVYAWGTKTKSPKYFYVGRGTGDRYLHILQEIKEYEAGKLNDPKEDRVKKYKAIKDEFGIECHILLDSLTEGEAIAYELCMKNKMHDDGNIILDGECMIKNDPLLIMDNQLLSRTNSPIILSDPFLEHYFGHTYRLEFDKVEEKDLLISYFYPFFLMDTEGTLKERDLIEKYILSIGGKVNKSLTEKTKSVIIQGAIPEGTFNRLKQKHKKILNAKEVLSIAKTTANTDIENTKIPPKETDYYLKKRQDVSNYIKEMLTDCGVNPNDISISNYRDEIHITINNHGFISLLCYRKKPGGVITIPLEYAFLVKRPLERITNWKGDFIFEEIAELDELKEFIKYQTLIEPFNPNCPYNIR